MGSGIKDGSCITDPLSLHINTHHQGVRIHSLLEPGVLISLGGSELFQQNNAYIRINCA